MDYVNEEVGVVTNLCAVLCMKTQRSPAPTAGGGGQGARRAGGP